jgi:hypothetical protein
LEITFKHIRASKNGEVLPTGGLTFAYYIDESDPRFPKIIFNYAKCHTEEAFCKSVGRELALARLEKNKHKNKFRANSEIAVDPDEITNMGIIGAFYKWFSFKTRDKTWSMSPQYSEYKEVLRILDSFLYGS